MTETKAAPKSSPSPALDARAVLSLLSFLAAAAALFLLVGMRRRLLSDWGTLATPPGLVAGLACFGLALGAAAFTRNLERATDPWLPISRLCFGAALGGFLVHFGWDLLPLRAEAWVDASSPQNGLSTGSVLALWLQCLLLGAVAFCCVGALPSALLCGFPKRSRTSQAVGTLLTAALLGAAVGLWLATTYVLPTWGASGSLLLGGGLLLVVGFLAVVIGRGQARSEVAEDVVEHDTEPSQEATAGRPSWVLFLACTVAGLLLSTSMVAALRGFLQVSFGSLASMVMFALAALVAASGGAVAGLFVCKTDAATQRTLGASFAGLGLGAAWILWLLHGVAIGAGWSVFQASPLAVTSDARLRAELLAALVLIGPLAFCSGLSFVALHGLALVRIGDRARWSGRMYACFWAGAAAGGVLTHGLGIARLGLHGTLAFGAALAPLGLLPLIVSSARLRRRALVPALLLWIGAGWLLFGDVAGRMPARDPLFFTQGVAPPGSRLLEYASGPVVDLAVLELSGGERVLQLNRQWGLGSSANVPREGIQAALPCVLTGSVERALVLGAGVGRTASMLHDLGVAQVDLVESTPEVLGALPWFDRDNGGLVQRKAGRGVNLIIQDPLAYVRSLADETYDLVIGNPFLLWREGRGALYSREHFAEIRRILTAEGVFCQWLPGQQLRWEELGIVGRTFAEEFDRATLWLARPDILFPVMGLVAGKERMPIDVATIEERIAGHERTDLLELQGIVDAASFLSLYVGDEFFFRDEFRSEQLNTLDRPLVEMLAGTRIETDHVVALNNRGRLFQLHEDVVGVMSTVGLEPKERTKLARQLDRASKLTWQTFDACTFRGLAAAYRNMPPGARPKDPEALEVEAFQALARVLLNDPENALAMGLVVDQLKDQLAQQNYLAVKTASAQLMGDESIGRRARLLNLQGMAMLLEACEGEVETAASGWGEAVDSFETAINMDPDLIEAAVSLGITLFLLERDDDARRWLEEARGQIVAPEHEDRIGLPTVAAAIRKFLLGEKDEARQLLRRAPPRLPYLGSVQRRIQ